MTDVTITIDASAALSGNALLSAYLHDPDRPFPPKPLRVGYPNALRALPDGLYYVALVGRGLRPRADIDTTFATEAGGITRQSSVSDDHAIADMVTFFLKDGEVQ